VPDLPRLPVAKYTIGRTYARRYRPSLFAMLTLPSYGTVGADGAPSDPGGYDYRRAARDAIHFGKLTDRFMQNLRRAVGWNVQYFAAVEPQRRGAPHLHAAIRGTIPRALLRQVAAATYHQVWWPPCNTPTYDPTRPATWPRWTPDAGPAGGYIDPATGEVLPTWAQALDAADTREAEPVHVVRFGAQVNAQGVLAGKPQTGRLIGYLTKYLTKTLGDCHTPTTDAARTHVARLVDALRYTNHALQPAPTGCCTTSSPRTHARGCVPAPAKEPRTDPRTSVTADGGSWSPAGGPPKPSPTTAPTAAPSPSTSSPNKTPTGPRRLCPARESPRYRTPSTHPAGGGGSTPDPATPTYPPSPPG
jgi:hypothetical protein